MPKFVLIDHSLKDLGGHHYPYAYSVLSAAERCGWEPVLAVNRRFAQRAALPAAWRVHALYAHASYSRHTLDTQARQPGDAPASTGTPGAAEAARARLRNWWRERARRRLARHFSRDCARLFEREALQAGDLVFVGTVSELDLLGLSAFLGKSGIGADCDWHLQFHFGIYVGREPDYAAQSHGATLMRTAMAQALRQSGPQRLHFYCTTEQLTSQYRRLGVAPFETLPYPVHELFRPREPGAGDAPDAPLRIACLGHSRREKGYGQLPHVLRELWRDWFAPRRAQLVLQTHRGAQRRALEALVAALDAAAAASSPRATPVPARPPAPASARAPAPAPVLDFAAFPLPLAAYARLLCGADVGLLLYDSTRYYARCSGVLLEMLCAGVPVLVPAGGWLAAQIEETNQQYLDGIAAQARASGLDAGALPADGTVPTAPGAASLLLSCAWRREAAAGEYLRIECATQPAVGPAPPPAIVIVGPRAADAPVRCLFRLPPGTQRARITTRNAWQDGAPPAGALSAALLQHAPPLGALGLTIAAGSEVPRLLDELLRHIAHYRQSVRAHAAPCAQAHSGLQVLAGLGARIAGGTGTT